MRPLVIDPATNWNAPVGFTITPRRRRGVYGYDPGGRFGQQRDMIRLRMCTEIVALDQPEGNEILPFLVTRGTFGTTTDLHTYYEKNGCTSDRCNYL